MGADIRRERRFTCDLRRCCEFAGSGDTHNDLRSAASLLSGDLVFGFEPYARTVFFTLIRKGSPCLTSRLNTVPFPR
ncbi:hypothetical protein DSCW_51820 [Desulfosarcina widdelii]|uniref:Uncharacterized protein n=1 Tax=Desulfosarcina widdelii TaxID=947919 RepID=A0A5K7ZAL3_9BACT|nr:hypothetical protein DSCW_51820 [Desulfosarcina widdelii]